MDLGERVIGELKQNLLNCYGRKNEELYKLKSETIITFLVFRQFRKLIWLL